MHLCSQDEMVGMVTAIERRMLLYRSHARLPGCQHQPQEFVLSLNGDPGDTLTDLITMLSLKKHRVKVRELQGLVWQREVQRGGMTMMMDHRVVGPVVAIHGDIMAVVIKETGIKVTTLGTAVTAEVSSLMLPNDHKAMA